ncbi:hypothetical protein HPB50_028100 [Hyalomma asiaticum]|nr:hypothetical protein HPB50_028099 [Hyalomma asiaticum]KAH6920913.1 hypothetical protein HPB50_028100 [Hyalomma asiaticum]
MGNDCFKKAYRGEELIGDTERNCVSKTTEEEDVAFIAVVSTNPFMATGQVRDTVSPDITTHKVRQRLQEADFKTRGAAKKPFLSNEATVKKTRVRSSPF